MTFKPGDLILIPFPYSDLQSSKKCPVLMLTAPDRYGDFIAMAVMSAKAHDHAIELGADSLAAGALPHQREAGSAWTRSSRSAKAA